MTAPSLALDVMEEFRPAISDVVVLSLVMNGELTLDDFEQTGENGLPVRLSAAGRETLISAHEARLSEPVFHPMANGETAYRTAIEYQARQIRWIVDGRATDYQTLQMR